jgi:hypothetical protein
MLIGHDLTGKEVHTKEKPTPTQPREKRMSKADRDRDRKAEQMSWLVPYADPDETWFRHHNWQRKRDLIRSHLIASGVNDFGLNRWDECGSECLIEWSDSEKRYRLKANHCRCRHCEPCAKAKATTLSRNLQKRLEQEPKGADRYRFITLTVAHRKGQTLLDLITKLRNCYRELRKQKVWKNSQRGGCTVLEVKWSIGGGWHPHLHITSEGDWLRQESLSRAWHEITGDSFKVDIRKLDSAKDAAFYVSKYLSKGVNNEVWNDAKAAVEYIVAMKGQRICATYGTWRGYALMKIDPAHQATDWKPIATLKHIAHEARQGMEWAVELLRGLDDALVYNPHKKRKPTNSGASPPESVL